MKPWQVASRPPKKPLADKKSASSSSSSAASASAGATTQDASFGQVDDKTTAALVQDVLEAATEQRGSGDTESVSARAFTKALASQDAVRLADGALHVGATTYKVDKAKTKNFSMVPSTAAIVAGVHAGLVSGQATLVSAPAGAGASAATRFVTAAVGGPVEVVRLSRVTTLDQLAGAMRPDETTKLRVKDGPLTTMVRSGGHFVVDNLEAADPQILACLTALARGAKVFHHPVSNEPIPVNPAFRLVMVADPSKKLPAQLPMACNVVEAAPYTSAELRTVLLEQHGLPTNVVTTMLRLHDALGAAVAAGEVDFGRGFSVSYGQLRRLALRLEGPAKKGTVGKDDIAQAALDIYAARLTSPTQRAHLATIAATLGLTAPAPKTLKSSGAEFVMTSRSSAAVAQIERALSHGETVLLQGPGQSGATSIVSEVAARRKQDVVSVVAHAGMDPQALMELPTFDAGGQVVFRPGRITRALLEGKLLSVEHLDHLPVDRQNAFFRLQEIGTISVVENGKLVEKKVHPQARIVLSATTGASAAKQRPEARDRALATEVHLSAPDADEVMRIVKARVSPEVADVFAEVLPFFPTPVKLQRALDFARAAEVLSAAGPDRHLPATRASGVALAMQQLAPLFGELPPELKSHCASLASLERSMRDGVPVKGPMWQRILGLSDADVKKRLATTPYRLVPSLERHLDTLAIAHALGRPVLAVGPAAAGKTVLGALFAALTDKQNVRVNFSASTEARDLTGGVGPVNEKGRTTFKEVDGPALQAATLQATLTADEWNLSKEARMALKSMLDHRRVAIDAERDKEVPLQSTFFYAAQNPTDARSGRAVIEPTILDCMFVIEVEAKPIDERVDIVRGHTTLATAQVEQVATFFSDLEVVKHRLKSAVAPITTTERDILKAVKAAEHFIARDGVTDKKTQTTILARETFRVIGDVLMADAEKTKAWGLVQKSFGLPATTPMPKPPTTFEHVTAVINGKKVACLQIGAARVPVRVLGKNPAADALIPSDKGLRDPIGPQLAVLESILLGIETKQPTALVGTTGTGKTMLMRWIARQLNWPVHEQAFHEDMTKDDLLGAPVLTKDKRVEFKYSPLDNAVVDGGIFIGDEYLTLPNETRETTNPITEGSELQIPSRPPRTVKRNEWHEDFRYFVTTNGGDIRKAEFSMAEASRLRVLAVGELHAQADLETIAQRDFATDATAAPLTVKALPVDKALAALKKAPDDATALTNAYLALRSAKDKENASVEADVVGRLGALPASERAQVLASIQRPTKALAEALATPVLDGKLTSRDEVTQAVEIFCQLRTLQQRSTTGVTPLSQRVFSSFFEILTSLRGRGISSQAALMRAAELTILSKMGRANEAKAVKVITNVLGDVATGGSAAVPLIGEKSVVFGDTAMQKGKQLPAWAPDNRRFPLTPARCHNLALLADAVELGRGRPISCSDDDNGETVEVIRELGRLTGRPVTTVTLSKNVDIDGLIEKLTLSKDPKAIGSFEPELQQIGVAVRDGHLLVLRGCGNIPTTKLERLNSLGDGRQSITLPRTNDTIDAHPDFRMVMLKKPNAPFGYSPALENRLLEPMLTTRAEGRGDLDQRVGELAGVLRERMGISQKNAVNLAAFHTYLNEVMRQGVFTSSRAVGSFLNRDAEAVAQRLSWLQQKGSVSVDDAELLHGLVLQVYGERFATDGDRVLLDKVAQRALGATGDEFVLGADAVRTPNLVRFGEWMLQADPRGVRPGVPAREDVLPSTDALDAVMNKVVAGLQFDEVIQLHGDAFVGTAVTAGVARLTTSKVIEIDGNEELSEAYLFGGLVQNQKTGAFEMHEGVLAQAQEEGATLVLKNASRVPDDVLLPLAEMAATGMVTRVIDGATQSQPRAFRLILQTNDGDPPLLPDLGQVATRINCQRISDTKSLTTILSHVLLGVPGGRVIAETLVQLTEGCAHLAEQEAHTGRQPLRYDSGRAVDAARQIAAQHGRGIALADAVADVVQRHFVRPARGLDSAAAIADLADDVGTSLQAPGVLEAELPPAIDDIEKPALALLLKDYAEFAPSFTAAAMGAFADAVRTATPKSAQALLTMGSTSTLLPAAARDRCAKVLRTTPITDADLQTLHNALVRLTPKSDVIFAEGSLSFMRGARLWDVEHRRQILTRFQTFFADVGAPKGADVASEHRAAVTAVIGRFDTAKAVDKVASARAAVAQAFASYQRRSGERDEQLSGLFRQLIERWDLVATSPIFVRHEALRQELSALSGILSAIEDAHEKRGEPSTQVAALVDEVKKASAILEGVRLAEQSTDLRVGLSLSTAATATLLDTLRDEVGTIRVMQGARQQHQKLSGLLAEAKGLGRHTLETQAWQQQAPARRSDAELRVAAARKAAIELAPEMDALKASLIAQAQGRPDPAATLSDDDDGADTTDGKPGKTSNAKPAKPAPLKKDVLEAINKKVEATREKRLEKMTEALLALEEKAEDARVEKAARDDASRMATSVARNLEGNAKDTRLGLARLQASLDLSQQKPALARDVSAAIADLQQLEREAQSWGQQVVNVVQQAADFAMAPMRMVASFFGGGSARSSASASAPTPTLDTKQTAVKVAATLKRVQDHLEAELSSLPDFSRLGIHERTRDEVLQGMVQAHTWGDLAAKVRHLSKAAGAEGDVEVRRHLGQLVSRSAVGNSQLLLQVAAFSESANALSSTVANDRGVSPRVAAVVEQVLRAADAFAQTDLADRSLRQPVKSLQSAIAAVEGLGPNAPTILGLVADEMRTLLSTLGVVTGTVNVDGGGAIAAMLSGLQDAVGIQARASVNVDADGNGDDDVGSGGGGGAINVAMSVAARGLENLAARGLAGDNAPAVERVTELRLLQLTTAPTVKALKSAHKDVGDDDTRATERKQVLRVGRKVLDAAEAQLLGLTQHQTSLGHALDGLEAGVSKAVLGHHRTQLAAVSTRLEAIAAEGGQPARGTLRDLGAALEQCRKTIVALSTLKDCPTAVVDDLTKLVEDAAPLADPKNRGQFHELAYQWSRAGLTTLRAADAALEVAAGAAPTAAVVRAAEQGAALKSIADTVAALAQTSGRLGAASAGHLLLATGQRLSALSTALPEKAAATAEAIAADAMGRSARVMKGSGDVDGERSVGDLVEAFGGLCAELSRTKKLTDTHVQALDQLQTTLMALMGQPLALGQDLGHCAAGIEGTQALKDVAKVKDVCGEMSRSFAGLRESLVAQRRTALMATHEKSLSRWSGAMQAQHAELRYAIDAFVDYDPLVETRTLPEVARALRAAVADADATMTGPAAILAARALKDLEARVATSAVKSEGDTLLKALAPLIKNADALLDEADDADVRFGAMLSALETRFAGVMRAGQRRQAPGENLVERALDALAGAVDAVAGLLDVPADALGSRLDDVEKTHFKALVDERASEAKKTSSSSTTTNTTVDVVESAVERALRVQQRGAGGAGGGAIDVSGGGGGPIAVATEEGRGSSSSSSSSSPSVAAAVVSVGGGGGAGLSLLAESVSLSRAPTPVTASGQVVQSTPGSGGPVPGRNSGGALQREALNDGTTSARTDSVKVVSLSADGARSIKSAIDKEIAAEKARLMAADPTGTAPLNDYQQFVVDNDDLVETMAEALRSVPNTELVVVVDQSGSTSDTVGGSRILDQERASAALLMAAVQRSESNCAVVGFGVYGTGNRSGIAIHKPMSSTLDDDSANYAFGAMNDAYGGTDFIGPLEVAAGQFSAKANNKLVVFLTDGQVDDGADVRRMITKMQAEDTAAGRPPTGVAFIGFGDARHIESVVGKERSAYARNFSEATAKTADLLQRCLVTNTSGIGGTETSVASGIGVSTSQQPLAAAGAAGLTDAARALATPMTVGSDPEVVYGSEGDRRPLANLADRGVYDRTLRALERTQQQSQASPQFRNALQLVREMASRHQKDGTHDALVGGITSTLPRSGGAQWARKQTAGTALDESELPMYLMGLEQGVPVTKIFKRRKPAEDGAATVVLTLDESTSMSPDKQRAAIEGLFAYADALKAIDEKIEIAILGFGQGVRLHAGFEQPWTDELKAQILMQVNNTDQASDDERAAAEALSLLKMQGADIGQVVCFSDGQGMPGMKAVMRSAEQEGYGFLTVGVGPESKSVMRFKENGLYARNLSALAMELPASAVKMWERAGRLVGG
jgi:MoxR-like ATPase